jgi:hypothetical protein
MTDTGFDLLLRDRLAAPRAGSFNDSDWAEVLQRANVASTRRRRMALVVRRRPWLLGIAALVLVGGLAVPAFGLGQDWVNFFGSSSAPPLTQEQFASMDQGAPVGMAPGVSGPARNVLQTEVGGKTVTFWVAPTKQGGFCTFVEGRMMAGCDRDRSLPIAFGIGRATQNGSQQLDGDVLGSRATSVHIAYEDGDTATVPLTTVSPPIDAGFFAYLVPLAHTIQGHRPTSVTALARDGSLIATVALPVAVQASPSG